MVAAFATSALKDLTFTFQQEKFQSLSFLRPLYSLTHLEALRIEFLEDDDVSEGYGTSDDDVPRLPLTMTELSLPCLDLVVLLPQLAALSKLRKLVLFSLKDETDENELNGREITGFENLQTLTSLSWTQNLYTEDDSPIHPVTLASICSIRTLCVLDLLEQPCGIFGTFVISLLFSLPLLKSLAVVGLHPEAQVVVKCSIEKLVLKERFHIDLLYLPLLGINDISVGSSNASGPLLMLGSHAARALEADRSGLTWPGPALGQLLSRVTTLHPGDKRERPKLQITDLVLAWDQVPLLPTNSVVSDSAMHGPVFLSSLRLTKWRVDGMLVHQIGQAHPHLTILTLDHCTIIGRFFQTLAMGSIPKLTTLRLNMPGLALAVLQSFALNLTFGLELSITKTSMNDEEFASLAKAVADSRIDGSAWRLACLARPGAKTVSNLLSVTRWTCPSIATMH